MNRGAPVGAAARASAGAGPGPSVTGVAGRQLCRQAGAALQPGPPSRGPADRSSYDPDANYPIPNLLGSTGCQPAEVGTCPAIADQIHDGDAASAFKAKHMVLYS